VRRAGADTKWLELASLLNEIFASTSPDPETSGETDEGARRIPRPTPSPHQKLVIFTEHRDTLSYLERRMTLPLSSGDQQGDELASLAAWVNWVAMAFDLSERWPSCWHRHEGLVFEMQSLRRWHVALRTDPATDPSSAIRWSEALHRVNAQSARHIAQRCLSTHRDAPPLDLIPDGTACSD
jgi:hypothetical protein